ncbi:MAG: hypothetical protein ACRC2S_13625 [Waterburya sp.]
MSNFSSLVRLTQIKVNQIELYIVSEIQDQVSLTSQYMAVYRAVEHRRADR